MSLCLICWGDLVFDPKWPSFELDLKIIKTNILSKIHDDCLKNVTAKVITRFSADLARWPSFWPQVTQFRTWPRNHQDTHFEQDSWWLLKQATPMLPSKFGVKWPFGSEEAKNRFSRWLSWRPSWISDWNDFSYFWSISHPNASYHVWSFFCVEVLRPSQPNGVISSAVSLPNHTFTGQA